MTPTDPDAELLAVLRSMSSPELRLYRDVLLADARSRHATNETVSFCQTRVLAIGTVLDERGAEPHTVREGGTPEDAVYWQRRNELRPRRGDDEP